MAKPFKPPPISDQISDTLNPLNWFSGFISNNIQEDIAYHLSARAHSKLQALPPISPIDAKEGAAFGPAGLSIDPKQYFKYGFANGLWGQAKKLYKLGISAEDIDAYSDWSEGWKPALIQEADGHSNHEAHHRGLVKKANGVTGEFLEGWVETTRVPANDNEKRTIANAKQSRYEIYKNLEWWTKTEYIKPYRDMAWTKIMENAIEATYFTAEKQRNEGTISQAEFDRIEDRFKAVLDKNTDTSLKNQIKQRTEKPGSTTGERFNFNTTQARIKNILPGEDSIMFSSPARTAYLQSITDSQDYALELHKLFKSIVTHDSANQIINIGRDGDGARLLENLRTLDEGESFFAWKDFLQKFDQGGFIRNHLWDAGIASVDLARIAEPIYAAFTGGKTMPVGAYKALARFNQFGNRLFPYNPALLMASTLNATGYFGLASPNKIIRFNNFAYLEFKEGKLGFAGFGAKFMASQFEGALWNKGAGKDNKSLYNLISNANYNTDLVNGSSYYKGLTEAQFARIGELLTDPDNLRTYIESLLNPSWNAQKKAEFLADLQDKIDKYKHSQAFRTLNDLVNTGKLQKVELFQFLGFADVKGLGDEFQGFVGFASKFPGQIHTAMSTWIPKVWKLPGLNKLHGLWSKYKLNQLFFNNPLEKIIKKLFLRLLGTAFGGPIGVIVAYLVEDILHKFIHNIWASLTGGHPHALIGDNTKKMFIIGCGLVLAIIGLPIFIIIILLGGAFALFTGANNSADEVVANQDVTVIVENQDTPINTIANDTTNSQQTKFDITVKNNLDKEITVLSVTISEYSEEPYWQGIKTITYNQQIANNIKIGANDEQTTTISLPFYNAVKGGEEGRLINLTVGATYVQTDGGAGSTSGSGALILGKMKQPVGFPVIIRRPSYPSGGTITQCFGHNGHGGLDIGIDEGTPLKSTLAGEVRVCNFISDPDESCPGFQANWGYGNFIMVSNGTYTILYAHLNPIPNTPSSIADGVQVNVGEIIAYSGNTGTSTGPHVHYEVRLGHFGGRTIDPVQFDDRSWFGNICK